MFDRATITLGIGPHSSSITCGFVVAVVVQLVISTNPQLIEQAEFGLLICANLLYNKLYDKIHNKSKANQSNVAPQPITKQ